MCQEVINELVPIYSKIFVAGNFEKSRSLVYWQREEQLKD